MANLNQANVTLMLAALAGAVPGYFIGKMRGRKKGRKEILSEMPSPEETEKMIESIVQSEHKAHDTGSTSASPETKLLKPDSNNQMNLEPLSEEDRQEHKECTEKSKGINVSNVSYHHKYKDILLFSH